MTILLVAAVWLVLGLAAAWAWSAWRRLVALQRQAFDEEIANAAAPEPPLRPPAFAEIVDLYRAPLSDEEVRRHEQLLALRYFLGDALARRMGHRGPPQARA